MKKLLHLALAALLALGTASFAVAQQGSQPAQSSAGDQKMQQRITREVRHELAMLPQLSIFDNLAFRVDGSTVTLLGQVRNAVLKSDADTPFSMRLQNNTDQPIDVEFARFEGRSLAIAFLHYDLALKTRAVRDLQAKKDKLISGYILLNGDNSVSAQISQMIDLILRKPDIILIDARSDNKPSGSKAA